MSTILYENINFDDFDIDKYNLQYINNYQEKIEDIEKTKCKCRCNDTIIDSAGGTIVCRSCGIIYSNLLDSAPEWKSYENEDTGRCNRITNPLLPQSSICTNVNNNRLRKIQIWNAMPYKERALNDKLKIIHEKCRMQHIQKITEDDANILYKIVSETKHLEGKNKGKCVITRGINKEGIIAASLFFACRRNRCTRSPKEIAKSFNLSDKDLNKGIKLFTKFIKMHINSTHIDLGTSKPSHFTIRKCRELNIKMKYAEHAYAITKRIEELNIGSCHTTYALSAACIYMMADLNGFKNITKKLLSGSFDVSEATITKIYKKINEYRDQLKMGVIENIIKVNKKENNYMKVVNGKVELKQGVKIGIHISIYEKMKSLGLNVENFVVVEDGKKTNNTKTIKIKQKVGRPLKHNKDINFYYQAANNKYNKLVDRLNKMTTKNKNCVPYLRKLFYVWTNYGNKVKNLYKS